MTKFGRKFDVRQPKKIIRIYAEGKKTEPNYLNSIKKELRLSEIDIRVHGMGDHTLPLVNRVIEDKKTEKEETEWWVVFDRDDHEDFDNSIKKASKNGINTAYSNESFELWFILHFEYLTTSNGRTSFSPKLSKHLGVKYEKEKTDVYTLIKDKESVAIRNASRLEKLHDSNRVFSPVKRDPSTTVYKLVERLRELKK
jgi:hypothetical protein